MRNIITTQLDSPDAHVTCSLVLGMMNARRDGRYAYRRDGDVTLDMRVVYLYCDPRCTEDLVPKLRMARAYLAHKAWKAYEARCAQP